MASKIPLALGPVYKAKRFKINAQQMNRKGSCCSDVPLGGSAATEGRFISEPGAAGNGQHAGLPDEIVGLKRRVPAGREGSLPAFECLGYSCFAGG